MTTFMKIVTVTIILCTLTLHAGRIENNGRLSMVVSGGGRVSALEYYLSPSNHVNNSILFMRDGTGTYSPDDEHEKTYPELQLHTGYGFTSQSNYYYCSASYIPGDSTSMYQTVVVLSRTKNTVNFFQHMDPHIQETQTNDYSAVNTGSDNPVVIFNEAGTYVGMVSSHNNILAPNYAAGYAPTVRAAIDAGVLPNTVVQSPKDAAGALGWDSVTLRAEPEQFFTRFYAGSTQSDILAPAQESIANPMVHVLKKTDELTVSKAVFTQKLHKDNKDKIKIKGEIDVSDYKDIFTTLNNIDISIYIGNYLGLLPGDGQTTVKKATKMFITQEDDSGKKKFKVKLKIKEKKGIYQLKFNFSAKKTDLNPATLIDMSTPDVKDGPYVLPFALIITGNNVNDDKAGHVWIAGRNIELTYSKKKKKAKGKTD